MNIHKKGSAGSLDVAAIVRDHKAEVDGLNAEIDRLQKEHDRIKALLDDCEKVREHYRSQAVEAKHEPDHILFPLFKYGVYWQTVDLQHCPKCCNLTDLNRPLNHSFQNNHDELYCFNCTGVYLLRDEGEIISLADAKSRLISSG